MISGALAAEKAGIGHYHVTEPEAALPRRDQWPVKAGGRFSAKARWPSR